MYYRFKFGLFVILSVAFWAVLLYHLTAMDPAIQTQLALDQMKASDEAAHQLRTVSTLSAWSGGMIYLAASLCYWWNDICHGIGRLFNGER